MIPPRIHCHALPFFMLPLILLPLMAHGDPPANREFIKTIEDDWNMQEKRHNREIDSAEAIEDALSRAKLLIADLTTLHNHGKYMDSLSSLVSRNENISRLDRKERIQLYTDIRWLTRSASLSNPLIENTPIVFMTRKRFICQMLHEYLGYYYDYGDISGGGIHVLDTPGFSFSTRELIHDRLPKGNYTTLSLSFDGQTLYFSFAARAPEKTEFYSPERRCFHLFKMNMDGTELQRLTEGPNDDFDPCPLPDGGLAFMSTRRGGFTRCNNPWEPLPAHTLHRLEQDGSVKTLSFHETSEWHPQVLNDGRIAYIRWDYVDRSAAHFHGIWVTNPDGSNTRQLFGNYTQRINACYQPHSIPGSHLIAFLAGAHHANVGGSLVLLDPTKVTLDPETGEDDFSSLQPLTPEVCFPEAPQDFPDTYYHSPWPLSENYFLLSYSFDPLPGMSAKTKEDTETGIYLFDRWGNLELLYRQPGISCMYPIPLRTRPVPPVIPSVLDSTRKDMGEFLVTSADLSHLPLPRDRKIAALHIYQILPKSETHVANKPRIGYANAESARMLLGSVPVERDGSASFRAPAGVPLAIHAVDENGRAVQGMRSTVYLQPGERRSCAGCHESTGYSGNLPKRRPIALGRAPSDIVPGPDGTHPWSFQRLVQPILNRHCLRCHDGSGNSRLTLTNTPQEDFTTAYLSLKPFVRWYEWGDNSISVITTRPGEMPSDMSPLAGILGDSNHASDVRLSESEWRALYIWLDGNAAFYGSYSEPERIAQYNGISIPPPALQ